MINRSIIRGISLTLQEELRKEFQLAAQPIIDDTVRKIIERFELACTNHLDISTLDRKIKLDIIYRKEEAKDA
ncbi:MAG: hypothetical protein WC208_16650, partial [Gallionella sp.]|jgi:hypothetical protein